MMFGNGTRLNIEPKEVFEPSYFILTDPGDDNKTSIGSWCLATGFTQQNITNNKTNWDLFNKTEAVRIDGDSLYNEVVPLAPGTNDTRCMSDEKVNLMSLTILGLRLLFLKTVVFNVLMTLRLWMSQ
ncbi:igV_TCR_alpha and Ig domain-containing protein isoform X16 [Scomber scombrus]